MISSAIPSPEYRAAVLSGLGITLMFLFFDLYGALTKRLDSIDESVGNPNPDDFDDYRDAEDEIYGAIESSLMESSTVDLIFLTVAGSYSWPFFEDALRRIDNKFEDQKNFSVVFCLVEPVFFDDWTLTNWKRKAEVTLGEMKAFENRYAKRIEEESIKLEVIQYRNIPHWHGVLVDGNTFFMGRTEWDFSGDSNNDSPELNVGQVEYRKFLKSDRFGGAKRIERLLNWVERYRRTEALRASEAEQDVAVQQATRPGSKPS